jgi:NAD(P)H-dependent FMN reductase
MNLLESLDCDGEISSSQFLDHVMKHDSLPIEVLGQINQPSEALQKHSIVILVGSVRADSCTLQCSRLVLETLVASGVTAELIELSTFKLPFVGFDGDYTNEDAQRLQGIVKNATGVILATPEYHGSFTTVLKNAIENLGYPSLLIGKPVLVLGVASGKLGAVKSIEHLQSVLLHCGAICLPGSVSVAEVDKIFDKDTGQCVDEKWRGRICGLGEKMVTYIKSNILPKEIVDLLQPFVYIDSKPARLCSNSCFQGGPAKSLT